MSLNRSESRFVEIDPTDCVYQSSIDDPECGVETVRGLNMPFIMPPMPLCMKHAFEFRDWTFDDTIREFVSAMTEEEMFSSFIENSGDDDDAV